MTCLEKHPASHPFATNTSKDVWPDVGLGCGCQLVLLRSYGSASECVFSTVSPDYLAAVVLNQREPPQPHCQASGRGVGEMEAVEGTGSLLEGCHFRLGLPDQSVRSHQSPNECSAQHPTPSHSPNIDWKSSHSPIFFITIDQPPLTPY